MLGVLYKCQWGSGAAVGGGGSGSGGNTVVSGGEAVVLVLQVCGKGAGNGD